MRPSSLYRSDSRRQPQIEANANNIHEDSIDCGVTALKCCNSPKCQKLGNKRTFMAVLILCAVIQGAVESYFRISAKQSAVTHEFDPRIVDWLLVAGGIFTGIFAIFVAYWGNRIHRTAWLGGIFMLQAVMCLLVIIPTIAHNTEGNNTMETIESSILCIRGPMGNLQLDNSHGITTLVLLFVLQLGIGLGVIAFYTLGFSYLDDNVEEHESPALLAAALSAKFWGMQLGSLTAFLVEYTTIAWTLGWIILAPVLFIIGFLVVMFPRRLLSTVVRQAANNILESATNSSHASLANNKFIADVGFFSTLFRVFTNKILLLNVAAAVFVRTAYINFSRHEANYLQSRFFLPTSEADGLHNEWTSMFVTSLLRPPMVALAILVAGLVLAKANPKPRKLVYWNIFAASLVVIFFIVSIFIDCENTSIAGAYRGKIIKPYCSASCFCPENIPFTPVCPENSLQTYYSPCHAGCGAEIIINSIRMFGNCSCGADTDILLDPKDNSENLATDGACEKDSCQKFWIAYQALSVIASALLGSTLIGKLIISLRAVLPQDKAVAISIELLFVGLIAYIPGKMAYRFIANETCQYEAPDKFNCFLHESPLYGDWLNIVTAGLIAVGILFEVILLFTVGDMVLYGDEPDDVYRPIEMENIRHQDENDLITPNSALLQRYSQPHPDDSPVTYAQIMRPDQTQAQTEQFDFRLQTAANNDQVATSTVTSGRSSISSGYIDLTQNINSSQWRRNVRPTSPETNF